MLPFATDLPVNHYLSQSASVSEMNYIQQFAWHRLFSTLIIEIQQSPLKSSTFLDFTKCEVTCDIFPLYAANTTESLTVNVNQTSTICQLFLPVVRYEVS